MRIVHPIRLIAWAAVAVAACDWLAEPHWTLERAVIELTPPDSFELWVPEVVRAGLPTDVSVTTYGGGCTEAGPTEANLQGMLFSLEPYDSLNYVDGNCTDILRWFRHTVTVTFPERGSATIRVIGLDLSRAVVTRERAVVVQ